jgi:hypothetical protein
MHEAFLDDPAEDGGVDVAAADGEHDLLAAQAGQQAGHQRGQRRGGGPLDDRLLQLDHAEDGEGDPVLGHAHHLVHPGARQLKGVAADLEHGEAVRQRGAARDGDGAPGLERGGEAGGGHRLDADDFQARLERLGREGEARDEPGPADGADDRVGVGHLLENLERHRALPAMMAGSSKPWM